MIMSSKGVVSSPSIAVLVVMIDIRPPIDNIKLQWTVAFMQCRAFIRLRRENPSVLNASMIGSVTSQSNGFRWTSMRHIFDVSSLHTPTSPADSEFSRYIWCVFLPSFLVFLPFIHHFEPFSKSASIIMIKRTPQYLRLSDPAMPAPPGMRSNFANPSDLKTEGLILIIFCLTVSTFVVSMRMWTKIRLLRKVVLEDCNSTFFRPIFVNFVYWLLQGFVV